MPTFNNRRNQQENLRPLILMKCSSTRYRAREYRIGDNYRICAQKGSFAPLSPRLTYVKCCNNTWPVPSLSIGWISWYHGRGDCFSAPYDSSWYWQIEVEERDCEKASFTSHHGMYRLIGTAFMLSVVLVTFQRALAVMHAFERRQFALVNQNDIAVFLK